MNYLKQVQSSLETLEDYVALIRYEELSFNTLLKTLQRLSTETEVLLLYLRALRDTLSNESVEKTPN